MNGVTWTDVVVAVATTVGVAVAGVTAWAAVRANRIARAGEGLTPPGGERPVRVRRPKLDRVIEARWAEAFAALVHYHRALAPVIRHSMFVPASMNGLAGAAIEAANRLAEIAPEEGLLFHAQIRAYQNLSERLSRANGPKSSRRAVTDNPEIVEADWALMFERDMETEEMVRCHLDRWRELYAPWWWTRLWRWLRG